MSDIEFWDRGAVKDPMWVVANHHDPDVWESSGKADAARVVSMVADPHDKDILDWGAGAGRVSKHLASHFNLVAAVDFSPEMVRLLWEIPALNVIPILSQATRLDKVPDASIDVVYSAAVWFHCRKIDVPDIFAEVHRVLKPSGQVIYQLPVYDEGQDRPIQHPGGVATWTESELREAAQGFELVRLVKSPGRYEPPGWGENHFALHEMVKV